MHKLNTKTKTTKTIIKTKIGNKSKWTKQ
jgi:hypothetical protein